MSYIKKFKEEKGVPNDQKSLLIWDTFKAQSTANASDVLPKHGIECYGTKEHDTSVATI